MSHYNHLHHCLFDWTEKQPQKVALLLDDQSLTYAETAAYVQCLALDILSHDIKTGEIICQIVDRSLEMMLGFYSILTAGYAYCALNPTDPPARIVTTIEELGSHRVNLILGHRLTRETFDNLSIKSTFLSIDERLPTYSFVDDDDLVRLSSLPVTHSSSCYTTTTSGSTGKPKIVLHTHSGALHHGRLLDIDGRVQSTDNVLQSASCTWVTHILEIICALFSGACLILLKPGGPHNLPYLTNVFRQQQVSRYSTSPTFTRTLLPHIQLLSKDQQSWSSLRCYITGGEPLPWTLAKQLHTLLPPHSKHYNTHGSSECAGISSYHVPRTTSNGVKDNNELIVPSGRPGFGSSVYLVDENLQEITEPGQQGEILYGGGALFKGYLNDPQKTECALIKLPQLTGDDQFLYRTGDMAKYTIDRYLVIEGRLDFQFKIRNQRIEAAEVEHIIVSYSPSMIMNCVVIKAIHYEEEHVVAYLAVDNFINEIDRNDIRQYCEKYLPPFSIPSIFMLLESLPMLPNGKIDRFQFPPPDFSLLERRTTVDEQPTNDLEKAIHHIWCDLLHFKQISIYADLYSLGGTSLQLTRLFNQYVTIFSLEEGQLNLFDLLNNRTIAKHAQFIESYMKNIKQRSSDCLPVDRNKNHQQIENNSSLASYAQERIWFDEQVRFDQKKNPIAIYNLPFVLKIKSGHISIKRLRQALHLIIEKHGTLRTSLQFHNDQLWQHIVPISEENFQFQQSSVMNDKDLIDIIHNEETNSSLFHIKHGRVVRLHIVRFNTNENNDLLTTDDAVILNFHHCAFDGSSIRPFFTDLSRAYRDLQLKFVDSDMNRYLDYTCYERSIDFSESKQFWKEILNNYDWTKKIALPYDHFENLDQTRSGRGTTICFEIEKSLLRSMKNFANETNLSWYQLYLSIYYVYLFKLTQNDTDLCVLSAVANRRRHEVQSIIGMFVNMIPCRLQINPQSSFNEFVHFVQDFLGKALVHSQLSYQQIVLSSNSLSIQTVLLFETEEEYGLEEILSLIDDCHLTRFDSFHTQVAIFDLNITVRYNSKSEQMKILFNYSTDLFEESTIQIMTQRFQILLRQLFEEKHLQRQQPIFHYSLLLPNEIKLQQELNNTKLDYDRPIHCLPWDFIQYAEIDPQKLSLVLDEQSMTYAELLDNVNGLARHLLRDYQVQPHEIICQCVERSFEMIIGQLAILVCGGVYAALLPNDSTHHLNTLIQQTGARLVLVQPQTMNKFDIDTVKLICITEMKSDELLSSVQIKPDDLAFLIFTSGSTGQSKAVSITHENFLSCIWSFEHLNLINQRDIVIQIAQCSFDVHVQECLGTLILGATVVLLHPNGNLDLNYLLKTVEQNQVSLFNIVPSVMIILCDHLVETNSFCRLSTIRSFGFLGEVIVPKTLTIMDKYIDLERTSIYNFYGPAECTLGSVYHRITKKDIVNGEIPMGRLFPNMKAFVYDEYHQTIIPGHIGELYLDGIQRSPGYYGREDLTRQSRFNSLYRTGDLVRQDPLTGVLFYLGRKDFQIKLHGQRIEPTHVERIISEASPSISACFVMKYQEYLVAYVRSSITIDDKKLRTYCQSHLPSFMAPSMFVVLEQFPLNANGKLDRNRLPTPTSSLLNRTNEIEQQALDNPIEKQVHDLWCEVLQCDGDQIPITANFFEIGGHSILFIQLYCLYELAFDGIELSMASFFQQATIAEHAQLLDTIKSTEKNIDVCTKEQTIEDHNEHTQSNHTHQTRNSLLMEMDAQLDRTIPQ